MKAFGKLLSASIFKEGITSLEVWKVGFELYY